MDYLEIRRAIVRFLDESKISAFDLMRIGRDLCKCGTCRFFVQHFDGDGNPVDFGHCTETNIHKAKKPDAQSCGFWSLERGEQ